MSMSFLKYLIEEPVTLIEDDPEVLVQGIGRMRSSQVRQKVTSMLQDVAQRAGTQDVDWKNIKWMLNHSALHAYVDTLIALQNQETE